MSKQLQFTFDGVDYTLEYTRRTVQEMERRGLAIKNIEEMPMTVVPALFAGAFLAHHRHVQQHTIDKIFEKITNKEGLMAKLSEMYIDPVQTLLSEPEDSKGNVIWTASW